MTAQLKRLGIIGRIRSKGDKALFGGNTTLEMKKRLGVPQNRPLADFLPTITIKAKDFVTEITNFNTNSEHEPVRSMVPDNFVRTATAISGKIVKRVRSV